MFYKLKYLVASIFFLISYSQFSYADTVTNDNAIIEGHLCISDSDSCTNPESYPIGAFFNADIKIEDDAPVVSLNSTNGTDWNLQGDLNIAGLPESAFSIRRHEEGENGFNPFIIETGTADNLLYLDAAEVIGINTNTPVEEVDINSFVPAVRLNDTSTGAGVVDMVLNTNEFTIEGNTGQDIFELDSRAPANSININDLGNVGLGTTVPSADLDLVKSTNTNLVVRNSAAAGGDQVMFALRAQGTDKIRFALEGSNNTNTWTFDNTPVLGTFSISKVGTGVNEFLLDSSGNGVFRGTVQANGVLLTSSRDSKTNFNKLDEADILDKIASLPLSTWSYKADQDTQHVGPMAEDFQRIFALGDGKSINTIDTNGITLAGIKALNIKLHEQDQKILEKDEQIAALQQQVERLSVLEDVVASLVDAQNADIVPATFSLR